VRDSERADGRRDGFPGLQDHLAIRRDRPRRRGQLAVTARRGRLAVTAVAGAACMFVAACSGGAGSGQAAAPQVKVTHSTPAAQLAITPGNGSTNVNPGAGVTVTSTSGKIQNVTVTAGGTSVIGSLDAAGTVWHSTWALHPSLSYTVVATALNSAGNKATVTSTFHTLAPNNQSQQVSTFEGYQQTYGVGMPIILNFSSPVTNKAAVEHALQVTTSKPVVGAWYWDGNQTLYFRPETYWPANTQVSFDGHLDGVETSPGVYDMSDLTQSFTIGASLISVASTRTHYMQVYLNGKLYGHWAISTGQVGDDTANGTYVAIEKANPTRMVGHGYNVMVPDAVRFTYSGNYIHAASWSVAQQGITNVSHGCVNVSPYHAQLYYGMAVPGDPVTVIGSPAPGKWDDGWTVWFLTWDQLLKGSALGAAVQAGPSGSTFVSPSTLPAAAAATPLQSSQPNNALAQ
jgi:lipoprotein-anchoring transpeptidase ErfK/SrfK